MSGRRYNPPPTGPRSKRAPLRTTQGRMEKLAAWLALQEPGNVPPVLVAIDRAAREVRVVVCPGEQAASNLGELVPTAAAIAVELDRLGAIVFGFDCMLGDTTGLMCVDVVQGSAPMAALIPYTVADGAMVVGRPRFDGASRLAITGQIANALGLAFTIAGAPDEGPRLREWMAGHGYAVDAITL